MVVDFAGPGRMRPPGRRFSQGDFMRTLLSGPSRVNVTNDAGGKTLLELLNLTSLETNLLELAVMPETVGTIHWATGNASNASCILPTIIPGLPIRRHEAEALKFFADTNANMMVLQFGQDTR
jgi:hypothetical protein